MKAPALFCLFITLVAVSFAATRPKLSETFTANTQIEIYLRNNEVVHGSGVWIANQPAGKVLERYEVEERQHARQDVYRLVRTDLKKEFDMINNSTCVVRTDDEPVRPLWSWVSLASYDGQKSYNGKHYDFWSFQMGYATVSIAVFPTKPNTPEFFFYNSTERNSALRFTTWDPVVPHESSFAVPSKCSTTSDKPSLGCVSRGTMISRAQAWVNARVPYNQGGTYGGYREDCSGYVSMAWEAAKPGYTTFTLNEIAHPISKGELQPGDVLLCRSEHVVLFGGWTNGAHSDYTAFEETRPGEGTVKRSTPYPYWYNTGCFLPYRFNSVC